MKRKIAFIFCLIAVVSILTIAINEFLYNLVDRKEKATLDIATLDIATTLIATSQSDFIHYETVIKEATPTPTSTPIMILAEVPDEDTGIVSEAPDTEAAIEEVEEIVEEVIEEPRIESLEPIEEVDTEEEYEEYFEEEYIEEVLVYYSILSPSSGVNWFGNQKETYYNLPMGGVISIMRGLGYEETDGWDYWVREDGVKMFGEYIMIAASLDVYPRGSLVETSLGTAIVCDTGGFAANNALQVDIAVTW